MFGRKALVFTVLACLGASCHLSAYEADFSAAAYAESGVPIGWTLAGSSAAYVSLSRSQPQTPAGSSDAGLAVNFYSATKENVLRRTDPLGDAVPCDTLLAELTFYAQPEAELVDAFQVVVSTNAWASFEAVGAPVLIEEKGRTAAAWVTASRKVTLAGLAGSGCNVHVGLRLIPAGKSHAYGYIHSLRLRSVAAATPSDVGLTHAGEVVETLAPGDAEVRLRACVVPDPQDGRLELEGVYGVIDRNGEVATNRLERVEGSDAYVGPALEPALDAGETLRVSAYSRYKATDLPVAGDVQDDGYAYEEAGNLAYVVAKAGSVWINELSAEQVELCGTTNRVLAAGWTLVASNAADGATCRADLGAAFDFGTNMVNGVVGLDVRRLRWRDGALPTGVPVTVTLCNARGVAEHAVEMVFSGTAARGFSGYAPWHREGLGFDWAGTATDGPFAWGDLAAPSFGAVNAGQGFYVPVSATLTVQTTDGDGAPLSHATVVASVEDFSNASERGVMTNFTAVSENGTATFALDGWAADTNEIRVVLSGSAFGWACLDAQTVRLAHGGEETVALAFAPVAACDDFSELADYWGNAGKLKWNVASVSGGGETRRALRLNTYAVTSGEGRLRCANYLSAHGRNLCSVAFDYRNTVDTYAPYDLFSVRIGTNETFVGTVASSPALSNKRADYGDGAWYRHEAVFALPDGFSTAAELWIELLCVSQYKTHTYTYVDNLRIAFQDVALPTNLVRTVAAPASGERAGFALDVVPQTTGTVADVSADLHLVLNGVTNVVPFAFADGTRTNALAQAATLTLSAEAVEAALGRPFLTGDEVTAFAAVHYDSANGDADEAKRRETRYFPDNAVTTNVDGTAYWIVEGGYAVGADLGAQSFTVAGAPLGCVGAPVATADGVRFTLHGYAANGLTNLTVNVGGVDYHPFEGLETNAQVRVTGDFELPTGLAPNTDYDVTVSAVDANGAPLPSATFSFTTLPTATAAAIAGVSPGEVRLTARGAAAGFVVPPGWTPCGAAAWTRRGAPNTRFTATVYATNRLGQASAAIEATPGFTHAAAATRAPVVEKGVTTVRVRAEDGAAASDDGNPEGTEYAVCVATSAGATNVVDVWKTLAAWRDEPETLAAPILDLLATNVFSFVTRSGDGVVTTHAAPATRACSFPPTAGFVGGAAEQRPDRTLAFDLAFFDPAGVEAAEADVEWRVGDGAWTPVYETPLAVVFEGLAATNTACVWNAWAAVGGQPGEYPYGLRVRMVSGGRASDWAEVSGVLDFAPPEALALDGTPAHGAVTREPAVRLAARATDRSPVTYHWTLNGAASTGDTLEGTAREGANTVSVWAEDALGNASAPVVHTWTLDTQAPEALALDGTPADGAVTREPAVRLAARATDATALTYHWTLNGAASTGDTLDGTAQEGVNTVSVVAEDAAGNRCAPVVRTWTLDTTPPTAPVLSGAPAQLTNTKAVKMAARAEDRTALVYRWTLNGAASTGDTLDGTAQEGANTVAVVAVDAAGNVSPETTHAWTVDTTPPEGLAIVGAPEDGAVTKEAAVRLAARAADATPVTYHWTLNGAASTGDTLAGTAQEGKNTATVVAEDAAGNRSASVVRTWTLDTAAPTKPALSGTPANGAVTNETAFSLAAQATDATALTYRWTLTTPTGERTATGATFAGVASADGAYRATVVAEDAAGNVSESAAWAWTVDTARPTVALSSDAPDAFNASKAPFAVTVAFSEPVADFTAAAVTVANGAAEAAEKVEGAENVYRVTVRPAADGEVVVQVAVDAVRDAAGNGNAASAALTRVYDTTAPTAVLTSDTPRVFNAERTPLVVTVTFDEPVTNFTAAAVAVVNGTAEAVEEDTAHAYRVTIRPAADGEVSVQVVAGAVADAAGNGNAASAALVRTNDTAAPTRPEVSGTPANGTVTNETVFSLAAQATDATALTYRWTLTAPTGERTATGVTFAGAASADGAYRATVVAEDAAGNVSESAAWAWTVDTARPTVVLSSDAPDAFNASKAPFAVTVAFSEPVADFTAAAVTVANGAAEAAEKVEGAENAYRVTVRPAADGEVVVQVAADAVRDAAGNGNAASAALTRVYDTTAPTAPVLIGAPARRTNATAVQMTARAEDRAAVTYHWTFNGAASTGDALAGTAQEGENTVSVYAVDTAGNVGAATTYSWTVDTAPLTVTLADEGAQKELYNAADVFTVTATFNKEVADVPAAAVAVKNGTVGAVEKAGDGRVWRVTVVPAVDGAVAVSLPAGAVADAAGNTNEGSQTVARRYDVTPPQVVLSASTEVRDEKNRALEVTAAFSEPATNFTAAAVEVENGTVTAVADADGTSTTYRVTVVPAADGAFVIRIPAGAVADAAGNGNAASEALTRVYDTEPPTKPVISGTPAHGATVRTKALRLVADATDMSGITAYRWYVNGARVPMKGTGKKELMDEECENLIHEGLNTVTVEVRDGTKTHWSERSETYSWTYDPDAAAGGVAFGGGVRLGVDDATGETNRVAFTAVDLRPGAKSALTLTGFTAEAEEVAGLEMWLVVCDTLGGAPWRVKVDAAARFDAATGALTVTLPEAATRRADGEAHGTLFVFGVADGEGTAEEGVSRAAESSGNDGR